jgi:hypothetical protein
MLKEIAVMLAGILALSSIIGLAVVFTQYSACMNKAGSAPNPDCVSAAITGSVSWLVNEITFPLNVIAWIATNIGGIIGAILILGAIWFFFGQR